MRKICFLIMIIITIQFSFAYGFEKTFIVEEIYEKIVIPNNCKAITLWGFVEEIEYLIIPTKIDRGIYKIKVKKIKDDIYEIEGKDIILFVKEEILSSYNKDYKLSYGESLLDLTSTSILYKGLGYLVTNGL